MRPISKETLLDLLVEDSNPLGLFARIYDLLETESVFLLSFETENIKDLSLEIRRCAIEFLTGINDNTMPPYFVDYIKRICALSLHEQVTELLAIAKGIDNALPELRLKNVFYSKSPHMRRFRDKYFDCGYYHSDKNGNLVLPKGVERVRGQRLSREFKNLARARIPSSIKTEFHRLSSLKERRSQKFIRFAVDPFIEHRDQLTFSPVDVHGVKFYRVSPNPAQFHNLRRRLIANLDLMLEKEVEVAVFPELVFNSELSDVIAEKLGSTFGSSIELIFSGTYFRQTDYSHRDLNPNSCRVFRKDGSVLFHQNKMHRYLMTDKEQESADTDKILGGDAIEEAASIYPRVLHLLDTPGGRFCVLICEDFARAVPADELIVSLGVSHIIVPVMDGTGDWSRRSAIRRANEPGSMSVISNSPAFLPATEKQTAHVVHPKVHDFYVCKNGTADPFCTRDRSNPFTIIDVDCVLSHIDAEESQFDHERH